MVKDRDLVTQYPPTLKDGLQEDPNPQQAKNDHNQLSSKFSTLTVCQAIH
jgi:hypothetical protein